MIGKLRGQVDSVGTEMAIIDVNGVGYVVYCPSTTLAALVPGEEAVVHVETVLREDMLRLYGFSRPTEMEWFRLLQTVQGVGAKVALGILSTLSGGEIAAAIATRDHKALTKVSGVGPRLGQRVVAELDGKVPEGLAASASEAAPQAGEPEAVGDAASALANLGWPKPAALAAARQVVAEKGPDLKVQDIVRHALKHLAKR